MATRNLTMVVHRKYARDNSKGLAINPGAVSEYSYVNMYLHDHYYDSCYLYPDPDNIDHQYTYIIWIGDVERTMIACHDRYTEECVFVMTPKQIIKKYKEDMKYTDFAAGETRCEYSGLRSTNSYAD